MSTYITDAIYSDHHQIVNQDSPKNSLRTFIKGNSRLAKIHFWYSTDQKELQMTKSIDMFKSIIENKIQEKYIDQCILFFKYISTFYSKNKIKKNKKQIFIYCVYLALKNELVNYKTISEIFNTTDKKIRQAILEISNDVHDLDYIKNYNSTNYNINISKFIKKLNGSWGYLEPITNLFNQVINDEFFNNHKPLSILASIFIFFNFNKNDILKEFDISETTLYQINKKLNKKFVINTGINDLS